MNLKEFSAVTEQLGRMMQEADVRSEDMFPFAIAKMNEMYTLPLNTIPTIEEEMLNESPIKRLEGFLKTLRKEVDEGEDIIRQLHHYNAVTTYIDKGTDLGEIEVENKFQEEQLGWEWIKEGQEPILDIEEIREHILTGIADWFGDLAVYGRSEAMKFGIPLEGVLAIIMGSNFTKLNPDGTVIKDANGKVQKGPNFRKPEPAIRALLFQQEELMDEHVAMSTAVELNQHCAIPALMADAVPEEFFGDNTEDDEEYEDDE